MSEMIERVAVAIDAVLGDGHESLSIEMGCGDIAKKLRAEAMTAAARAAIEAMREPTEAQLVAARAAGDDYYAGDFVGWDEIPVMWRAMIDAALSDDQEKG